VINALTISQPYASLIADGKKWVENRTWGTHYRGLLAIHAGKGSQYLTRTQLENYPTGCIVAVAVLGACIDISGPRIWDRAFEIVRGRTIDDLMNHEHTEGPWCWVLENVTKLDEPVPCSGKQGLWIPEVRLDVKMIIGNSDVA